MAHRDNSSPKPLPTILRYGIAVLSVAIATGLGLFLRQFEMRLTPFLFAVGATVWYAGTGPGVLAIVLAVLSLNYFILTPFYSFSPISNADLVYLTFCTLFALIVGWVSAARRRVEQELRQARDELDAKVVERTADLSRSEGYLAEAQRLGHTGSWAWNVAAREITHWSQESYRLYGFDPKEGIPPFEAFLQRVHPEDRGRLVEDLERAIREKANHEMAFRAVLPDGTIKYMHGIGHPVFNASGDVVEFAGAAMDVTERKRAEEERQTHLWFLESMDRINRAIQGTNDREQMMSDVLDTVLSIFDCDRAWLVYPCDPEAASWRAQMEHTRPDFPGAFALGVDLPMDAEVANVFQAARASSGAVRFGPGSEHLVPGQLAERFSIQSMIGMAVYPKADQPYMFGLHQCSYPGVWTPQEEQLFREIGRRIADALSSLLMFRSLRESEARLEEAQRIAHVGYWERDLDTNLITWSDESLRIFGLAPEQGPVAFTRYRELVHSEDRQSVVAAVAEALRGGRRYDVEYRVVRPNGEVRIIHSRGDVTRDESSRPRRMFGTVQDITERKRAEEALRESEYKLRQIIETVPGLIWSTAPDGEPTDLNQRMLDYSGMQFEDYLHGGWEALLHPDDFPETAKAFHHAIQTGTSYQTVHRLRRADGEFRWYHVRGEPLRDRQGRIIQWYGLSVDIDEAKKTEDRLRRSEAYLAEAQRLSHTGSAVYNETTILYWSEETYRIWGVDPLQGIPSREAVRQRMHPDDRDRAREEAELAWREKRGYSVEFRIVLPDGTVKHLEANSRPVFSTSGEVVEVIVTHIDLTERKRAEEALRESEAKFRDYAETASDWFWETGPDYKFTLLTENAFGSRSADRIGTACWDHALDLETEPEKWRLVWATPDSRKPFRDFVYRGLGGNGTPMYVRASGKPMFDANGEFRGYRGTGTDVTAIMGAQEALRESERSARAALDGIAGLVAVMAPNGELETANRQVLDYFGRSLEWLKNWGTNDAVHPEDLPRVLELYKRAMASGIPFNFEVRLRRFDGEYRWFDNRGVPIRDDSGRIARWYSLLTDIEDRTRALAELEQMQSDFAHVNRVSMMGELAASLSHEITQPIASARNNARAAQNFLDMQPLDLSEVREALSCVVGDTDRAGDIVDRIRDHIKKAPPRKEPFDLNEAINEVIGLGRSAISKNGVSVQTRLCERLFPIHCDRVQLQQVVLNLLLNAVEAMGASETGPRQLLISTEQDHAGVLVAVRDSGPGIDPSHLERVFDTFYTTKSGGTGMGLSICRSIIAAHGGRLWAEANEPRGTIFQFTLPAAQVGP